MASLLLLCLLMALTSSTCGSFRLNPSATGRTGAGGGGGGSVVALLRKKFRQWPLLKPSSASASASLGSKRINAPTAAGCNSCAGFAPLMCKGGGSSGEEGAGGEELTKVVFVLGGPGAGKGTQCDLMAKEYGFVHLSVGELLRNEVGRGEGEETNESRLIKEYLKEGKLVPVEISMKVVRNAIDETSKARAGSRGGDERGSAVFLVDGFPRNFENLNGWNHAMLETSETVAVIIYDCPLETLQKRILSRGESSGRSDDNIKSAKKRFDTFQNETMPVVEKLKCSGVKCVCIKADGDIGEVWTMTKEAIASIFDRSM